MLPLYCDPARLRAERGHPLVLGHRGMPGDRTENRIEAFVGAVNAGADGVEFDVQLSADGIPVVVHDTRLGRVTGSGRRVTDLTFRELEGFGLYGLEKVLDEVPAPVVLNIEIKNFSLRSRGIEEAVSGLVKARNAEGRVLFSSFNPLALARLNQLDSLFYTAQLTGSGPLEAFRLGYLRHPLAVHPHFREVTSKRLQAWRRAGRRIIPWGANSEEELTAVLGWDIDGIITDLPAQAAAMCAGG